MNQRTNKEKGQWLDFALDVLVKKGPEVLKIEPLCKQLNVTKGSFYHHFKNRRTFIDELMQHWLAKTTTSFIEQAGQEVSGLAKLEKLDQIIASQNIEAEVHIRAWALREPCICEYLEQIDKLRRGFLSQCYQEIGMPIDQAEQVALLSYASFLGLLQVYPRPNIETCLAVSTLSSKSLLKDYI